MTEDMERVSHAISGQVIQLANLASNAAQLAVQMAGRRAWESEHRSREDAAATAERLRADRELAGAVWARSRSRGWLRAAGPDELVAVWASARAWAPHDSRAAAAVAALTGRVADLGVDVDAATAALDAQDADALGRMLTDRPGRSGRAGDGSAAEAAEADAASYQVLGRSSAEWEEHVLGVLRGEWSAATVEAVADGEAFGALVHKLGRLEYDGHDLSQVVRTLSESSITGPDIRQPAAFAAWLVDNYAAAKPVKVAAEGYTEPASETLARAPETQNRPQTAGTTKSATRALPDQRER